MWTNSLQGGKSFVVIFAKFRGAATSQNAKNRGNFAAKIVKIEAKIVEFAAILRQKSWKSRFCRDKSLKIAASKYQCDGDESIIKQITTLLGVRFGKPEDITIGQLL